MEQAPENWKSWVVATPGIERTAKSVVRSALIDAVFNSTVAIASGGIACAIIGLVTAWRCGSVIPFIWTIVYTALVGMRLAVNRAYARSGRNGGDKDSWARRYAAGALVTAAMLGAASGAAVALDLPTALLIGLCAMGSAGGIAGRNAMLPRVASAQCILLVLPTSIGGFWSSEPSNIMMAPCGLAYLVALFSFIRNYYTETSTLIVLGLHHDALPRHDALTGVPNRRSFEERLAELWPTRAAPPAPLALLLVDIDNFRRYNDLYGRPAGDACLRHIAVALRDLLEDQDMIARLGGKEFAVLLPECTLDRALLLGNSFCRAVAGLGIEQAMRPDEMEVVTVSVGIATSSAALSAQHLMEMADRSLYRAKRAGRNRVHPESVETLVALQRPNRDEDRITPKRRA